MHSEMHSRTHDRKLGSGSYDEREEPQEPIPFLTHRSAHRHTQLSARALLFVLGRDPVRLSFFRRTRTTSFCEKLVSAGNYF